MKRLYITNGECFNEYFKEHENKEAVPFNETMMSGEAPRDAIFSPSFCKARAATHGVTESEYIDRMKPFFEAVSVLSDEVEVHLYFGDDAFCRMNLLTLLAFFEQKDFHGRIFLTTIDDESFSVKEENREITLSEFEGLYREVLIERRHITVNNPLFARSVSLYFDFLSDDGLLARSVKESKDESDYSLLLRLLGISKEYGLSDVMAKQLIESYKVKA